MRTNGSDSIHATHIYNPNKVTHEDMLHEWGLAKREYFAAMALQGLIAYPGGVDTPIATLAVRYADELIKALNEEAKE